LHGWRCRSSARPWQTRSRKDQSVAEDLASRQPHPRHGLANAFEDKPGSTANLKETSGMRKVIAQRPLNEPIPRAKPEVTFLKPGELGEVFPLEPALSDRRIFSETE